MTQFNNILGFLIGALLLFLSASLFNCNPPQANAYTIKFAPTFDSTMWDDPNGGLTGVWVHPLGDTAIISWEIDSVQVPYAKIEDFILLDFPEGSYQFHIYPKHKRASSPYLLWESWEYYEVTENSILGFAGYTDQFLVLLDTTNTWDFNTESESQGYQYRYYMTGPPPTNFWPSYQMDYYCGTKGVDSTYLEYAIDSARARTIYAVRCLQSFGVRFEIELRGAMDSVHWTLHEI